MPTLLLAPSLAGAGLLAPSPAGAGLSKSTAAVLWAGGGGGAAAATGGCGVGGGGGDDEEEDEEEEDKEEEDEEEEDEQARAADGRLSRAASHASMTLVVTPSCNLLISMSRRAFCARSASRGFMVSLSKMASLALGNLLTATPGSECLTSKATSSANVVRPTPGAATTKASAVSIA